MKYLLAIVGIASVLTLGFIIDAQSRGPAPVAQPLVASQIIFAPGQVEGTTPEIELRPQLAGRIVEIPVREGQMVQAGEILLRLDFEQSRQEVSLAESELELAKAQYERLVNGARAEERAEAEALHRARLAEVERARRNFDRFNNLREAKAVAQQELDDRAAELKSALAQAAAASSRVDLIKAATRPDDLRIAQARITSAKARLELARDQLEKRFLRSPGKAQILKIHPEVGELAGPETAEPAVILVDTSRLYVRAFVEELDAPRIELGMPARIVADGLPGHEYHGKVARLSPRMGSKLLWSDRPSERQDTKVREIWVELEKADGLVVGLRVDVTIDASKGAGDGGEGSGRNQGATGG
ncbi:MAG: HlyD family secretion protein [Pirellulales bacterium]